MNNAPDRHTCWTDRIATKCFYNSSVFPYRNSERELGKYNIQLFGTNYPIFLLYRYDEVLVQEWLLLGHMMRDQNRTEKCNNK